MKMTVMLTKNGYSNLCKKLDSLVKNDLVDVVKLIEETRPIGCSDEFPPEYLNALDIQNRVEKKIADIRLLLSDCRIFNKNMGCLKNGKKSVGFGSIVKLHNYTNNKDIVYTIVSSYESDINNGLMSIDAPFALEMKGLVEGDEFEFNDNEYEIINISYID